MSLRLEDLRRDALVKGLLGRGRVVLDRAQRMDGATLQVVFLPQDVGIGDTIVFRSSEDDLELVAGGRKWNLEVEGAQYRLVAEADQIRVTWLVDTFMAMSSSTIDLRPQGAKDNLMALNAWVRSCTPTSEFEGNANTREHRMSAVDDNQEHQQKIFAYLDHCHTHRLDHLHFNSGCWTGERR